MLARIWGRERKQREVERRRYGRGANPNASLPDCTHTHTQRGAKRSAVCVWFNYDEMYASDVDSIQVRTGMTGCHQSVSNGLPQLGHLLNCTHTHTHMHGHMHARTHARTHCRSQWHRHSYFKHGHWSVCAIAYHLLSCGKLTLIQGKEQLNVFDTEFTMHKLFRICIM